MTNEVITKIDNRKILAARLEALAKKALYVGIPEAAGPEVPGAAGGGSRGGSINNATLGYIHEKGSTAQKIPARPWLGPGVRDSRDRWEPHMVAAAKAAVTLQEDEAAVEKAMNRAGLVAVAAVKRHIRDKIPPPLKPATIMARRRRHPGRKAGKPLPGETKTEAARRAAGHIEVIDGKKVLVGSDVTPLVDTAQLINSISYVVRTSK